MQIILRKNAENNLHILRKLTNRKPIEDKILFFRRLKNNIYYLCKNYKL
jgi:hypothetical protein